MIARRAAAILLLIINWVVTPLVVDASGSCKNEGGVARESCPAEACDNGVPGCTTSSWASDGCDGVGQDCFSYSNDKALCNAEYGCTWHSGDGTNRAGSILILIALVALSIVLGLLLRRWILQRRRGPMQPSRKEPKVLEDQKPPVMVDKEIPKVPTAPTSPAIPVAISFGESLDTNEDVLEVEVEVDQKY